MGYQRTQQAAGNGPVDIQAKGRYRDAVRSTQGTVVKCYGLKWISLMRLVPLPWSTRPWALPFLTVLAPSERAIWREVLTTG